MLDLSDRVAETTAVSPTAPMQIGVVTLNVHDVGQLSDYYRRLLGLEIVDRDGSTQRLGVGRTALLDLRGSAAFTPRDPKSAGLFHTAFLMPSRGDLAAWLRFVAQSRIGIGGASDHAVSEALYLTDPEGNGIEVYGDRPRSAWPTHGTSIEMTTEALDVENLMAEAPHKTYGAAPAGLIVGHMHLQVGRLTTAEPFYNGVLGLDITTHYPGATFYGAGGYHHQLATNMWNSRGADQIDPTTTGLTGYEIVLDTAAQLQQIEARAASGAIAVGKVDGAVVLTDPSGLAVALTVR